MDFTHCTNCQKKTGHKRSLGIGTLFAVLLTGGFWLLALPFYPKRCIVCGQAIRQSMQESAGGSKDLAIHPRLWYRTWWGILILLVLFIMAVSAISTQ
ncbi:hypothetical protein MNBD_NITROSPIRAE03-1231 [hydrothermal vent metagenome]|uniref:LITAF domain-containing protein n=1 Tax=hydrothermal vent metagenome TaxID=652676 RepID=A0A3B1D6X7_9ZZZZ